MWVILAGLMLGQAVFVVSEYWLATWARQSYQVSRQLSVWILKSDYLSQATYTVALTLLSPIRSSDQLDSGSDLLTVAEVCAT